jgi:hypothetical protein
LKVVVLVGATVGTLVGAEGGEGAGVIVGFVLIDGSNDVEGDNERVGAGVGQISRFFGGGIKTAGFISSTLSSGQLCVVIVVL